MHSKSNFVFCSSGTLAQDLWKAQFSSSQEHRSSEGSTFDYLHLELQVSPTLSNSIGIGCPSVSSILYWNRSLICFLYSLLGLIIIVF